MSDKDLIQIAKDYYDKKEADEFHFRLYGGENTHVGIYENSDLTIKEASHNTILEMLKKLPHLKKSHKILDIGSGYGGAARVIAEKFGCRVDCLNLSERENKRNLSRTKKAGLDNLISVEFGNFEELPFDRESYDFIWSQDALVHSNKKDKVLREVSWVLKPGGRFIFSTPMQSDDCPDGKLKEVLAGLHLSEMGSVKSYNRLADRADLERVSTIERPQYLVTHYSKVLESLKNQYGAITQKTSEPYVIKKIAELQHWIDAGKKGYLNWGILQFQKRNT